MDINLTDDADRVFAEGNFAAIVEHCDDAIISISLAGRITSWNFGATTLFGYSSEEMIGQHIKLIIPSDRHTEEDEILARNYPL